MSLNRPLSHAIQCVRYIALENITSIGHDPLVMERYSQQNRHVMGPTNLLNLPDDLEYTGEFGPELVLALPFFNWLSLSGLLKTRRIITYRGMKCFYDDLECRDIIEKTCPREWVPVQKRAAWLPVKDEHTFDKFSRSPFHVWPDLRMKFKSLEIIPDITIDSHPILIVHNKYCVEWSRGPVNFLSISLLRTIFENLSKTYTIIYIRHGSMNDRSDYAEDHNYSLDYNDADLIREYENVHSFESLYMRHVELGGRQDLNTFKNVLYSRCHHFISSQGGGAHQIALYSGSMLMIMHRHGHETKWAYKDGYYTFMTRIPPITVICQNDEEMVQSLPAFVDAPIVNGRVLPRSNMSLISSKLFPNRRFSI